MSTAPPPSEPSRDDLLAEVEALRRRVEALQQANQDLEVMLEMATEHADELSDALERERDDLAVMLEVTTEHADTVEEELHSRAEALAARSQFIRDTFGRYVSEEVVAQLLDAPEGLELGGEKRTVTILMSDVRGFTAMAERLDPQEVCG
jgi:class 3 adenylate cyclase